MGTKEVHEGRRDRQGLATDKALGIYMQILVSPLLSDRVLLNPSPCLVGFAGTRKDFFLPVIPEILAKHHCPQVFSVFI